jgi:arylsulfatase A-like enzyme
VKPTRVALIGAGLGALWLVAYFIIVPDVVADAYAGRSFLPFLNRAISGQSLHPVEHYVSVAQRALLVASIGGVVALGAGVAAWHWRKTIVASTTRLFRREPTLGVADVVLAGIWFGLLGGALEGTLQYIRFSSDPRDVPTLHVFWVAPLMTACLLMLAGVVLSLVGRAWKGISVVVPVVVFVALQAFAIIAVLQPGIHRYAIAILSLGLAIQAVRLVLKAASFPVLVRRSLPWMVLALPFPLVAIKVADWSRSRVGERGEPQPGSPNVLLLILDTVRQTDLSLYGYPRETTPAIDRLASTGVTFDHAFSSAPWTLPAHASMLTGLPPDQHGADFHSRLNDSIPTLAERLRARGYETGGFVGNLFFTARSSGLARGFSVYRDFPIVPGLFLQGSYWTRAIVSDVAQLIGDRRHVLRKSAERVNEEFLSWVPDDGRPFFAFLNYIDAHSPYTLKPPYDTRFHASPPRYWLGWDRDFEEPELAEIRAAYNSAIAYIDAQIGELLTELDRRGVLRNTLVIISSDHGEHFGENGGIVLHANSLYLPLLQIPLVMALPGTLPATRVKDAVSTADLPATILDVVGLSSSEKLPGRSLVPLWARPDSAALASTDTSTLIYADLTPDRFANAKDPIIRGYMQSLVKGRLHYIRNGDGVEEVYDYLADPHEVRNLATGADSTALVEPFRQHLRVRAATAVKRPSRGDAGGAR